MDTMETTTIETTEPIKPRRPFLALLLSFLSTGFGHIYCGRFGKGIVLVFVTTILMFPAILRALPIHAGYRLVGSVAFLAGVGFWIYAMVDSWKIAKRTGKNYVLKDYNRWWVYLLLYLLLLLVSTSSALQIRESVMEAFIIPSKSMSPTIEHGDRVLANKVAYRSEPLRRGDVIVFPNPNKRHQKNIKRVVALAGDTVEIKNNQLIINGKTCETSVVGPSKAKDKLLTGEIREETNHSAKYEILVSPSPGIQPAGDECSKSADFPKTKVPNGHCFVLGDNRDRSEDSRVYGPVLLRDIVGRVEYIYFPRFANLRTGP
jgi:signal peptidase I